MNSYHKKKIKSLLSVCNPAASTYRMMPAVSFRARIRHFRNVKGRYRPQFVWWWTTKSESLLGGGLRLFRLLFAFLARLLVQLRHLLPPTQAWNVQKSRTASSLSFLLLSASAAKFCFWRVIPVWCSAWSPRRVNVLLSLVPSFLLIWLTIFGLYAAVFSGYRRKK